MPPPSNANVDAAVDAKFRQGVRLHQNAKYAEAARVYQDLLRQDPNHFDALHLLGVIALQTGKFLQSVELLTKALKLNPATATAFSNLGSALIALHNYVEALQCFDNAIAIQPEFSEAHSNRAAALMGLKRPAEALASCDRAIAQNAGNASAYNNRADALIALKRYEEALASADKAISIKPDDPNSHNNRGIALNGLMRYGEALTCYGKAIELQPIYAEAYNNRGNVLYNMARLGDALASYDKAISIKKDYAEAYNNRSSALSYMKRYDEALASYEEAVAIRPDRVDTHFNKSLLLLRMGRFAEGWPLYEWRKKKANQVATRGSAKPQWLGESDLAGKTLLLYEEQGLGDTIQFCRYAKLAADLGAQVILQVPKALKNLLIDAPGVTQVVETGAGFYEFDYQCSLMSLPLAFKTDLTNIPAAVPYLKCNPEKSRYWKEKLGSKGKLRVGLVWSGGFRENQPETWPVNKRRNIALNKLASLKHPDIEYFSLQKGQPGESELVDHVRNNWAGPHIFDFSRELKDFSDTAALIDNLDLIIAVDTSTAHLAGALGKRVWILNRFDGCWRWLTGRTDSPWYPTATLYTQDEPENWDKVIERVRGDLFRCAR
ncbi:MAG: tetratricopeptide repeat protein [Pseudolabrys sp.]